MVNSLDIQVESLPSVDMNLKTALPCTSGVYVVISGGEILYVGQSINIRNRWKAHHRRREFRSSGNVKIAYCVMPVEDLIESEKSLIQKLNPRFNRERVRFTPPRLVDCSLKNRLQQWIDEADLNYSRLAEMAGVSVQSVRTLAKNQAVRVDLSTWESICGALKKPVEELFYKDEA